MNKAKSLITYFLLRLFGGMLSLFSLNALHKLGRVSGILIYHLHREFRKKTMTNLAIAYGNTLTEKEKRKIAKESFQNLTITCLELLYIKRRKIDSMTHLEVNQPVFDLLNQKKGIVFLSGHQGNWEIPFLAITQKYSGIAIGRPIKNKLLYQWILSRREMNRGKIVMPRNAIREGVKALAQGEFVGIVGDQAFPESSYSYPFMGTRAWTTPTPALLAYKTNSPLVVGLTKRVGSTYHLSASPPLWPDTTKPLREEVPRLMNEALGYLEKSIKECPGQWMWQHDRWKQQGIDHVKREYRYGFILVILPQDPTPFLPLLPLLRRIYPRGFLSFLASKGTPIDLPESDVIYYEKNEELFLNDWRFQLVIDFKDDADVRAHFRSLGAFQALNMKQMIKISRENVLEEILLKTFCKPDCIEKVR